MVWILQKIIVVLIEDRVLKLQSRNWGEMA